MVGISDGLAVVEIVWVGEHLDAGAAPAGVVVALARTTAVGQDGAEVGIRIPPTVVIIRVTAGICGTLVVVVAEVVTNL